MPLLAGITLFNGFVATLLGGWIGDRLLKKYFGAYYTFPGIAMLIAVPFMVLAVYVAGPMMFPVHLRRSLLSTHRYRPHQRCVGQLRERWNPINCSWR